MKSVVTLLEKDPSMLDRNSGVLGHILHYASDSSKLVRESTLGLIQTCITLKPSLDASVYPRIIERTRDAAVGVRKRALKMLKGMYLRNQSRALRSTIADAIISRIQDDEDSISEIARSTIEEIWFQAFYGLKLSGDRALEARLAYGTQTALLIATVDRDDNVMKVLEGLTKHLVKRSKAAKMNVQVCGTMVEILFDGITDNSDIPGTPPQNAILRSLTLFAKTTPELFTAAQLERLEPYTQNLTKSDELEVYRYVITILRHTMPNLSTLRKEFLAKLQDTLLKSCTRLQKPELREVAPCLWTINKMLGNIGRLVNFQMSVLLNVHQTRDHDLSVAATATKVNRLMVIASEFGNACNLNTELASFKAKGKFDWYKGDSVSGLIMEILCGFTSPKQPIAVRRTAIDCICTVSQAWPKQFLRDDVISAFDKVFKDRIPEIETVLLGGLEAFFVAQEVPDESADIPELGTGVATGTERLGRTYVATDEDGAITSLAQRSLAHILRIAVASCDEPAFIAARLVISVNKQGLVHPKESGPALIALETCPNKTVASEAFKEHMSQHLKHESVFEKEYMRAVQQTFEYQSKVIGNAAGSTGSPPSAKMHLAWEVLKTGKAQIRKKFLTNISQKLDFDPIKLDARATTPTHISFVRFCCENLAFFEYDKVDDLLHLLTAFDKLFSSTGSAVAQTIESEVQKLHVDNLLGSQGLVNSTSDTVATESSHPDVSPDRLRQLAVSAQIISLIHETKQFLRRVWNAHKYTVKTKKNAKDAVKVPTRANNAEKLAESYLKRVQETLAPVATEHEQRAACIAFVDLMSVNHEVKIASDGETADAELLNGYDTPSEQSSRKSPSVPASGGGRGRKRKSSVSAATPRKKGKGRKSVSVGLGDADEDGGWD